MPAARGRDGAGTDLGWPLRRAASLFGSREAVVCGAQRETYTGLSRRVAALATAMKRSGVPRGGRVGFLGVNSIAHLECWFGVPMSGRVLVDMNLRLADTELEFIVNDCEIELLVVDHERVEVGRRLRLRCQSLRILVVDGPSSDMTDIATYEELVDRTPAEIGSTSPDTLAGICYTGGTTGTPKGVMLTHANLLANAMHNLIATGHSEEQCWLHVPPMFHVAGTANVFACTWAGTRQVILPRFEARAFIAAVKDESVTHCSLVPTMLGMLVKELDDTGEALSSLQHIQYAASPITPVLQRRIVERFDCEVVQFYGMTEAAPTVTRLSADAHRRGVSGEEPWALRLTSIGTPVIGVEAAVYTKAGERAPAGEVGELCVRGPNVMAGYWNRPDTTSEALAGGWYHTGDAVWADEAGYLFLVDRLKDMVITGGENVYSIEVEAALAEHPAVAEVAVFGVPHADWGEAVHAVVSVVPGATVAVEELIGHCRKLIAGYKTPRSIEIRLESLPKSGAGKILKTELRDPHWRDNARRVN